MSNTKKTPLYDDEGQLNRFPETIKEVEQYETRLEREEGESMLEKHVRNTNEKARPYPDHVSGTFMDKSELPQHILDKMKKNQEDAKNEKAQSAEELTLTQCMDKVASIEILAVSPNHRWTDWADWHRYLHPSTAQSFKAFRQAAEMYAGQFQSRISQLEQDLAKSQEKCKAYEGAHTQFLFWHPIESFNLKKGNRYWIAYGHSSVRKATYTGDGFEYPAYDRRDHPYDVNIKEVTHVMEIFEPEKPDDGKWGGISNIAEQALNTKGK